MTHLQSAHSEFPDTIPFSLFEGDLVTRIFQRLGMGSYRVWDLVKRSLYLSAITWIPPGYWTDLTVPGAVPPSASALASMWVTE